MARSRFISILLSFFVMGCVPDASQVATNPDARQNFNHGDFSRFEFVDNMKPNSYSVVMAPSGDGLAERFYIDNSNCIRDDCNHNSFRSAKKGNIWDDPRPRSVTSPRQAWYSFEIYFPPELPYGMKQTRASYILTEFKENNDCATFSFGHVNGHNDNSMSVTLMTSTGSSDHSFVGSPIGCSDYYEGVVGNMRQLVGRWTRFEYFVRWDEVDGFIEVFRDGERVLRYSGKTCDNIQGCLTRNIPYYGIYMPNVRDVDNMLPASVYFRNVSMAQRREDLVR